jgi:hypothetical protein
MNRSPSAWLPATSDRLARSDAADHSAHRSYPICIVGIVAQSSLAMSAHPCRRGVRSVRGQYRPRKESCMPNHNWEWLYYVVLGLEAALGVALHLWPHQ